MAVTPYVPDSLPLNSLDWVSLVTPLAQANAELARYDGILQSIVNPYLLLSPLSMQEAVLSSRIEGTQATLEQVLEFEASPDREQTERRGDIQEVINYRTAMRLATDELKKRPLCLSLLKQIHFTLLDSVRGRNKARGQFRKDLNWIGGPGSKIEEATFVPPHHQVLMQHLSNLEQYIHYDERDRLVQLAIIHAQFELIHPFMDGNGRVGRILIPLWLYDKRVLSSPMFYLSAYLQAHQDTYFDRLQGISEKGDWHSWICFFLDAIRQQAKENSSKAQSILALYDRMKTEIARSVRSQYAIAALDAIFAYPVVSVQLFVATSGIPMGTARRIIRKLEKEGILQSLRKGSGRRPAVLTFPELITLTEARPIS
ncbi:MAG: Fic family protein [Planctomycetes bacterium]|nr:Fic family protein [Planctomycetota bacterium]